MFDVRAQSGGKASGAVAGSVIGEHGPDGDSVGGEERCRALPEGYGGFCLFVCEYFGVRQAGMVVYGVMEVGVTGPGPSVLPTFGPSQGPVPAALWDASELLDVDMDQVSGTFVFIALRGRLADGQPCALVKAGQPGHPVPGQDLSHRRACQMQVGCDPVRTPAAGETQRDDPPFGADVSAVRAPTRPRGLVLHTFLAKDPVPIRPFLRGGGRAQEPLRGPAQSPALIDNQPGELSPGLGCQVSVGMGNVGHEGLLASR